MVELLCMLLKLSKFSNNTTCKEGDFLYDRQEFKRLSRSQLIEIIYQLQLQEEELKEENQRLREALEDKRLRIDRAGSIAEAAIAVNEVIQAAQNAANQYLKEIELMREEVAKEHQRIFDRAQEQS